MPGIKMTTRKFILYLFLCWMAGLLFYWYYMIASISETDMLRSFREEISELKTEIELLRYINNHSTSNNLLEITE
jgi:hypothetical protein